MMSLDWITIARPYAKAIFELGMEQKTLKTWSQTLEKLALMMSQPEMLFFTKRPDISPQNAAAVFIEILKLTQESQHLVELLANTGRLGALPAIYALYEKLRADYEKTIHAEVATFEPLTKKQEEALITALKKRLNREVNLVVNIDKSLLGGVVVHAGDLVVDGSIRGKLRRLNDEMMK